VNVQKENINKLTFIYPGDSSFALTLKDKKWMINEEPSDSAKTANYFANITHLSSNEFADNFNLSNLTKPLYTIRIEGNNFSPIELRAYSGDAANRIVLTSSMNEGAKFSGDKNDLFRRVFVGRSKLSK
jgi:hypothetical protein